MPTITFNSNDAALAVHFMTETATADLPFVSRQQSDADFARIGADNRSLISNLIRLHGLQQLGNAMEGDEEAADKIITEAAKYMADPTGYAEALFGPETLSPAQTEPTNEPQEIVETPAAVPLNEIAPQQVIHTPAVQAPLAKLKLIPRVAQSLFPGLEPTYHNELIPTAHWETPKPFIPEPDPDFLFNGHAVSVMALALEEQKNVLATGDPGCGKTEFFRQFGARTGLPVHKIPMDGSLTRAEIIGSFRQVSTPTGSATPFVLGRIPKLIQQPGIIILDEIDQADPDIMYMLHPVLEGGGLTIEEEGGTLIPRHPNCYFVGTANTKGRGSDNGLTHARFEMSEATRDRFPYWLNFTFMKEDKEAQTIHAKTQLSLALSAKMVGVANNIRNAYKHGTLSQTCSIRQMLDAAPAARRFSVRGDEIGLAIAMETVMVGRANVEDAAAIREFIKTQINVDLNTMEF